MLAENMDRYLARIKETSSAEGEAKGRVEGEAKGRTEGMLDAARRMVSGGFEPEAVARILGIDATSLQTAAN